MDGRTPGRDVNVADAVAVDIAVDRDVLVDDEFADKATVL